MLFYNQNPKQGERHMTIQEIKDAIKKLEAQQESQAPYFDGRLMDRIEKLKKLLNEMEGLQ